MTEIHVVKLTKKEQALYDAIRWDTEKFMKEDFDTRIDMLEKQCQLTESLLKREAIPHHRLAYFTEPKMNLGGCRKSRKQVLEQNGRSGLEILRDPSFTDYLRYFILGPDLPKGTIRGFCQIIEEDRGTSHMVLEDICKYVRKEVRDKRLSKHDAANEFFKLAYEINKPRFAEHARKAAMSVHG